MFKPDELVNILVKARGKDVMAIRVREKCSWADWLILCSGNPLDTYLIWRTRLCLNIKNASLKIQPNCPVK